jgi:HAD superfamily hydrolase (TIGR01459 family)
MRHLQGMSAIAGSYDGFIVDLWGVIHDGVTPYAGAVECLLRLHDAGKRVVMLSNAPRRAAVVQEQLRAMGVPDHAYIGAMTSGEATHLALRDRVDPWYAALGTAAYHLGPRRDLRLVEGLDLAVTEDPARASFVLNTGPDDHRNPTNLGDFQEILATCRAHALPMICANPDLEVIRGGMRVICAGALARRYQELGGDVRSLGKPDPAIYAPVFEMLAVPRNRILAVGDALRTDIAGAAATGIDACWVLGGIHGEALAADATGPDRQARDAGLAPVARIDRFTW